MMWMGSFRPQCVGGVTLTQTVALVLPVVFVARTAPGTYATLLVAALIAALVWEGLFAVLRRRGPSLHGLTTALIVTVLIPTDLAVWQLIVAVSLGVILGELVFGGRGFGFLNPATVALSLLLISFPQVQLPAPTQDLALATLPGAVVLLTLGLISWRTILAATFAAAALLAIRGHGVDPEAIATALAFGLIFLICDPTSAAATNAGRWIYGALAGGLVVLFSPDAALTSEAVVFAALMASVFAPLIDHLVVLTHSRLRRVRQYA